MLARIGLRSIALSVTCALALTACGSSQSNEGSTATADSPSSAAAPSGQESAANVETSTVVEGLDAPWSVAFVGDAPLVSERDSGRILELVGNSTREVGTVAGVQARGEVGLLGIAFHENYLYAYFTTTDDNRIDRFPLEGPPGGFTLGQGQTILEGLPAGATHNGGRIAFGPDGLLYATAGDAGTRVLAQDLQSLGGKILRMNPDGTRPASNPFPDSLVYSYGHRNPQGIAWGPDGTMYSSEFGQSTWDELNVIRAGANYGWPEAEGAANRPDFVDPVQQWRTNDASPRGITVHDRRIYIANLRGERLITVPLDALNTSTEQFVDEFGRLRDAVSAPDGSVWIVTNNTDGRGDPRAGDDRILRLSQG